MELFRSLVLVVLIVSAFEPLVESKKKKKSPKASSSNKDKSSRKKSHIWNEIENLQSEFESLRTNLAICKQDLQTQINTLDSIVNGLSGRVDNLDNDVTGLQNQVTSLNTSSSSLGSEVATLDTNLDTLQEDVNGLNRNFTNLQSCVGDLKVNVSILDDDVHDLESDVHHELNNVQMSITQTQNTINTYLMDSRVCFHARVRTSIHRNLPRNTRISFDDIILNTGNAFDGDCFTAPTAGVYMFHVNLLTWKQRTVEIALHVNSIGNSANRLLATFASAPGSTFSSGSNLAFVHLNAGDVVCAFKVNGQNPSYIHRYWTTFSGCLVRQDAFIF